MLTQRERYSAVHCWPGVTRLPWHLLHRGQRLGNSGWTHVDARWVPVSKEKTRKKVHSIPSTTLKPRVKWQKAKQWMISEGGLTFCQQMFVHVTDTEVRCGLDARCG